MHFLPEFIDINRKRYSIEVYNKKILRRRYLDVTWRGTWKPNRNTTLVIQYINFWWHSIYLYLYLPQARTGQRPIIYLLWDPGLIKTNCLLCKLPQCVILLKAIRYISVHTRMFVIKKVGLSMLTHFIVHVYMFSSRGHYPRMIGMHGPVPGNRLLSKPR